MIPSQATWTDPLCVADEQRRQGGHGRAGRLYAGPGGNNPDDGLVQPGTQPGEPAGAGAAGP